MECERGTIQTIELQSGDERYIAKIRLRTPDGELKQVPDKRWESEKEAFKYLYRLNELREETEEADCLEDYPEKAIDVLNLDLNPTESGDVPSTLTLSEFVEEKWSGLAKSRLDNSTYSTYQSHLNNHILPKFGDTALAEISQEGLESFYVQLYQDDDSSISSVTTIKDGLHKVLKRILNKAVDYDFIDQNPAQNCDLPRRSKGEVKKRFFDWDQLRQLLNKTRAEASYSPIYEVTYRTGLRRAEVLGLKWKRVDFEEEQIRIEGDKATLRQNNGSGEMEFVSAKASSERVIPMDQATHRLLRKLKEEEEEKFERLKEGTESDTKFCGELVFTARNGNYIDASNLNRQFNRILKKLGMDNFRFYDLRHTHATHALESGVPLTEVSRRLGHEDLSTSAQYLHHSKTARKESTEKLEDCWQEMDIA